MNRKLISLIACSSIALSAAASLNANAAPAVHVARPFEWTIEISTQKLPHQFQYTGSALKEVVKASLNYYSMEDQAHKTPYEDLWYAGMKTLGLERHHKLEITQGDAIAIRVVHKNPGAPTDEQIAAGKAVMKALLDANINRNMVATIKVPQSSFYTIASEIQNYDFSPAPAGGADMPVDSDMNIFLESEPAAYTQSFVHYN